MAFFRTQNELLKDRQLTNDGHDTEAVQSRKCLSAGDHTEATTAV